MMIKKHRETCTCDDVDVNHHQQQHNTLQLSTGTHTVHHTMKLSTLSLLGSSVVVFGIDNGKGLTPPMGWRSWNLFGADVSQDLIKSQVPQTLGPIVIINAMYHRWMAWSAENAQ
jgi:hypothetical protein